jgi:hypothetical protein
VLGIFSLIRFEPDYCLIVGVCLTLSIANIVGFTKCRKGEQGDFFLVFRVFIICLNLSLVLFIRSGIVLIHVFPMVESRCGP